MNGLDLNTIWLMLNSGISVAILGYVLKTEHRFTKLETQMETLLERRTISRN